MCDFKPLDLRSILKNSTKLQNNPAKLKLLENFKQLTRITLTINDTKFLQLLTDTNVILKSYDIIAVRTTNQKIFYSLCLENDMVDILCFDLTEKLPFALKRGVVTEAIKKGIMFEISYSQAIEDAKLRRMIFSNAIIIMSSTKNKNIILSSAAEDPFYHRSPQDVVVLSTMLEMSKDAAVKCVSEYPARCIKRAEFRNNFKGTISFATSNEENLFIQKQIIHQSIKKIKPNEKIEETKKEEIEIETEAQATVQKTSYYFDSNRNRRKDNLAKSLKLESYLIFFNIL